MVAEESCWDLAVGDDGELPGDKAIYPVQPITAFGRGHAISVC